MYDVVVIGSGPGGYIAAIRAAQLGMDVACVERESTFGGTCLNVGCIPSKALLEASHKYEDADKHLDEFGIEIDGVQLDLDGMMSHKSDVVDSLVSGVDMLFKKNGVDGIHGHATIQDSGTIEVQGDDGESQTLETERIVIATGSKPTPLPGVEFQDPHIVDSTGALEFEEVPDDLVVIGGGYIGLEMGSVWNRLGSNVTVLEFLPRVLSGMMDEDIASEAKKQFSRQGLDFRLEAEVDGAEVDESSGRVTVTYNDLANDGEEKSVEGDRVLVAVGRRPFTDNLGLENVGLETDDRGFLTVDQNYETDVDGIFAIGDVIGDPMLAHKAEDEGVVCVERMNDMGSHINYDGIPGVVYTHPELAAVGRSEDELKESGVDYNKGKFHFRANGRARALNSTEGYAKILAHAKTDKVLGAQIIGPRAGDLITEIGVNIEFHGSSEDIARASHAHPSLSEVIKETALDVTGDPLNS